MRTDQQITNTLEHLIVTEFNDYLDKVDFKLDTITANNVSQEFPDVENGKCSTMIWIVPTYGENEELSFNSNLSSLSINVFITTKRDKTENLQKKVFGYLTALECLVWHNQSLNGEAEFMEITSSDFYPAIEGDRNYAGVEVVLRIRYTKIYE